MKGIYKIVNKVNQKFYLGSTQNFHIRKLSHFASLRRKRHHSIHLQRAFDKYGEENFEFTIVEECENTLEREQELLDSLDLSLCYNISGTASGGNMLLNHPDKEKLKREAGERLRKAKRSLPIGDKNPNWKGGKTYCSCGIRINSGVKACIKCTDKTGKNNPFFGKKHNKETKDLISQSRKGKYNGNQEKVVIIDKIEYISLSEAARIFKVVPATILNRIKSKNYPNYKYK